jgi:gluconolactonase
MQELATGYGLVEGPVWDPERGLIYSDVVNGGVYALDHDGTITTVIPKRRGIGGIAAHADGGLVVSSRDVIFQSFDGARMTTLLTPEVTDVAIGFNDLTTDAAGRVWVGSLAFRVIKQEPVRPGHLHVIDLDGSVRTVSDGIRLTNGLGFSPDGRRLYHSDARSNVVRAYDITEDGTVSAWRPLAQVEGVPDGLAVAEDGSIWVANAEKGYVIVFEPDGSERSRLPVPLPMVTSLCFGGKGLRDLYVVTGSRGGPRENCGSIFRTPAPVPGLPVPPARVAVS